MLDVPSSCLVVRDRTERLSYVTEDKDGFALPGFLGVAVPGRPGEHKLFDGVDSISFGSPYFVVGCEADANVGLIELQAFHDTKQLGVDIDLWSLVDHVWVARQSPKDPRVHV